jgi:uncharacterized protein YndB with AHSA1/START domain
MWLTHGVYIEAPVEKVFAFWLDPANQVALAPDGQVELIDVKITEDGVGTSYRMGMKVMGRTIRGPSMVYTRVIPNELIVDRSSNGMHWHGPLRVHAGGDRDQADLPRAATRAVAAPRHRLAGWPSDGASPRADAHHVEGDPGTAPRSSGVGHVARGSEDRGSELTT